jgi:hypothetical protein
MPPLVCPTPTILDQSFPRNEDELRLVAESLGALEETVQANTAHLLLTHTLQEVVSAFDWRRNDPHGLLKEIYRLLSAWFLQSHERLISLNLDAVTGHSPHPIPEGCTTGGYVDFWRDELGKLHLLHEKIRQNIQGYCVGVGCDSAFCGKTKGKYADSGSDKSFPLVGPSDLGQLKDAYDWDVHPNFAQKRPSFNDFKKHYRLIGGQCFEAPASGSHYKIRFPLRSWIIDSNYTEVPDDHVKELEAITGYPPIVVTAAMITGKLPPRTLKLPRA